MGLFLRRPRARRAAVCAVLVWMIVIGAIAAVSDANVNVSKSGWAWANPTPQGRTLSTIAFSGNTGYAAGFGGTALSTTNAGQSWSGLTTGTTANLERVQALAPETIIIGGGGGCVTRISEDKGAVFKRIFNVAESRCPEPVAAFSFVASHVGFLLLKNGSVEATEDGGETFSRKTGIPGTAASSGGGGMVGAEVHFFTATSGIAFVSNPGNGASSAYMTPDGGVSWVPVSLPSGARVTSVYFVNEKTGYAIGPETLLSTKNGGETWTTEPIAAGKSFNSIDCSSEKTCVLTLTGGNELIETADGGATDTIKTTSSSLIYSAAYASASQIVAIGESGATVLSNDGGATFTPASADIGGSFGRLRLGPEGMLLAAGGDGDLAVSKNGGETWKVMATQTSQELIDVSFASPAVGYALDASGGLQRTSNGGASWQTLSPGTSRPAEAVVAVGERTVLLVGPVGISRAVGGGPFEPVGGSVVENARLSDYDLVGPTVFAFGTGTHTLIRSNDEGEKWSAIKLPLARKASHHHKAGAGVTVRSVAFTSPRSGILLDGQGRLWSTRNGGGSWSEILSAGASPGVQLAFGNALDGFLSVREFGGDGEDAYVLRTSDGGVTWHPQEITEGSIPSGGLVSGTALGAAALIDGTAVNGEALHRLLFSTVTGGEVPEPAGSSSAAATLTLSTRRRHYTRRKLRAVHGLVRVTGTLSDAVGGEKIVVSRRNLSGGGWQEQRVIAGANGGSFTTTWHVSQSSVFVAQWAGDSGRTGEGSKVLEVTVK